MKKNYYLLAVLLSLLSLKSNAQLYATVGTGTLYNSSQQYPAPYGNYYYGSKHQMFITASELNLAGIGGNVSISGLAFNIQSLNNGNPHIGWTVKVYTTTSNDPLASGYISTGQVAASNPVTATGAVGWNQTAFVSPFTWNGTDNIVVETCFNNGSWVTNYSTYYTDMLPGPSVKTRHNHQDNSFACSSPNYEYTEFEKRPNIRFEYVYNANCAGLPGPNSVVGPVNPICPNTTALVHMASMYSVGNLTYQWQSSMSGLPGSFTNISGATNVVYTTPALTSNTYYNLVVSCSSGGSTTLTPAQVSVAPVTISQVPYLEDFEGIVSNNELPNCSWVASNIPMITQTYVNLQSQNRVPRSGSKFASFVAAYQSGSSYFYSNGIQLYSGITYSATVWYTTDFYGSTNVSELAMQIGPNQTPTGLTTIAAHSPAASGVYKALTNTFQVPSSGIYYVAIKATTNGSYGTDFLSWDDLSIIIPCSLNPDNVTLSVNQQTICQGEEITLNAGGADTYLWNTGATDAMITDVPQSNQFYSVTGTNTLTGCATTLQTSMVTVNPSPNVSAYSTNPVICPGEMSYLIASGAPMYLWDTNSSNTIIAVSPTLTTTYQLTGTNSYNCSNTVAVTVQVKPAPTVAVTTNAANNSICKGETATLNGNGAFSYQFFSNAIYITGPSALVNPNTTTTYTVIGTNSVGCTGKTTFVLTVNECTGLNEIMNTLGGVSLYPNPTEGQFTVELKNALPKTVQITDLTGRIIQSAASTEQKINMDIRTLANGIYYVKITSGDAAEVIRIIKN